MTSPSRIREKEMWKPVPDDSGILASSWGRILFPTYHMPNANGSGYRTVKTEPTFGYMGRGHAGAKHCYRATYSRKLGNLKVHQLVCAAFHGPKPFDKAVVIHLDEDGQNNRPENLKWGTQKENLNSPKFIEYCKSRTGADSPRTKWAAAA